MKSRHSNLRIALSAIFTMMFAASRPALAIIPPDVPAPSGYNWVLGPNLIPNPTFESDPVGTTPTGWKGDFGDFLTVPDGATSTQSGELTGQAFTSSALVSGVTSGRFFQMTVTYKDVGANSPTNFFTSPVRESLKTSLVGEPFRLVGTEDGTGFVDQRSRNNRLPGVVSYNHTTNVWIRFTYTFETLPGMTNHNSQLDALFNANDQGDSTYRIDDVMFQEFMLFPIPEPVTLWLLGAGMPLLWRRLRR